MAQHTYKNALFRLGSNSGIVSLTDGNVYAALLSASSTAFDAGAGGIEATSFADFTTLGEHSDASYSAGGIAVPSPAMQNPDTGLTASVYWTGANITYSALAGSAVAYILFYYNGGAPTSQKYPLHIEDWAFTPDGQDATYVPNTNGIMSFKNV